MRKLLLALLLPCALLFGTAHAADRIVAVVNDQVITLGQLQARAALNLRQVGIANPTAQQQDAAAKRSLSNLIDEELERQFANKSGLTLTQQEEDEALAKVKEAMGGNAAWASLTKGVEPAAKEKVRAETLRQKIVKEVIQPRVQVSTADTDRLIAELAKSHKVSDREISIIMLEPSTNSSNDESQLQKLVEIQTKLKAGESFAELARAHSDDKSAVNGGKLGWFGSGELNPQLEESLDKLAPGEVSEPIRTPTGWYLVKLDNLRESTPVETTPQTQMELFLLAAPTPQEADAARALSKQFDTTTSKLKSYQDVVAYFKDGNYAETFPASTALGWVTQNDLESDLATALENTRPGRWSNTVTINGNMARLFLANTRQVMSEKLNTYREKVFQNLFSSRVELEARRFLQNLRQRAFLDIRL